MTNSSDFRGEARQLLTRAKEELGASDDNRLPFAALLLRMAMEALIYSRASAYRDEFPPSEYSTWQPRRVLSTLLEIDSGADREYSISVGIEEEYGVPPLEMNFLGSDRPLTMNLLKQHYDALGSYLHVPTIGQRQRSALPEPAYLRERCNLVAREIESSLAGHLFNAVFGTFATIDCVECGNRIRRRVSSGEGKENIECFSCVATYEVICGEGNSVTWKPEQKEVKCGNPQCESVIHVWRRQFQIGNGWSCPECGGTNVFRLYTHFKEAGDSKDQAT